MFRLTFALVILLCQSTIAATEDKRVALVIGNASYKNVNSLKNPVNDATDIASALSRLGFGVTTLTNATASETRKALTNFTEKTRAALVSLIYYSGHAVEVGGNNLLIPVDGNAESFPSILKDSIGLDQLLEAMAGVRDTAIVLIDGARNDPYPGERLQLPKSGSSAVPANVLIGFATQAGRDVADGIDRNSPYTAALLKHIETERVSLQKILTRVRDDVIASTNRGQQPFIYGSFSEEIILSR